ncbi:hypothetical protein BDV95DRAFT_584298 [Massariosphaeria phaeospora]|uniref:C2H2-type domain-containing protein n=1 Tax=Massariosphaeria phaeospora TaxID=100035 RepID=A0A7C8MGK9_9PLEO|nr:hypothetical protein BDV95DRAFT_584298 [Massariosphaeria phaeospora]
MPNSFQRAPKDALSSIILYQDPYPGTSSTDSIQCHYPWHGSAAKMNLNLKTTSLRGIRAICDQSFSRKNVLIIHEGTKHPIPIHNIRNGNSGEAVECQCQICGKKFSRNDNLILHMRRQHPGQVAPAERRSRRE